MSKTKLKIAIEQRKYGVCGEGIAAMYVCVKQGDVQEGHRVDDGCRWLNWEDRGWEGLRKKKGRTPSIQHRSSTGGCGRAGVFHWVGGRRVERRIR